MGSARECGSEVRGGEGRRGEASRPRRLQSLCGVAQTGDQVGSGCASVLKEGAVAGDPPGPARSWSISWLTARGAAGCPWAWPPCRVAAPVSESLRTCAHSFQGRPASASRRPRRGGVVRDAGEVVAVWPSVRLTDSLRT